MPDFTSSLYLDMRHSSDEVPKWSQLTCGLPAALFEPEQAKIISNYIANMQGLESGMIAPSTLHIYHDLYGLFSKQKVTVFIDEKIYPVSTFGIEKLSVNNIPFYTFKHLNASHLYELVSAKTKKFTMPVVLTDGSCPQCGKVAPINKYISIVSRLNGKIVIDDTQAFGILGKRVDDFSLGYGGGGTLQWLNIFNGNIISITSLAKAFGVPIAAISGSKNFISTFKQHILTRETSSPVSFAHLNAAENAILINATSGDFRRKRLLQNILLCRKCFSNSGIQLSGGLFPVQAVNNLNRSKAIDLFNRLNKMFFKTVLTKDHNDKTAVTFIIRVGHSPSQVISFAESFIKLLNLKYTNYDRNVA